MYFSDAFQIEEISINKNDYELLKFLTVYCMCFCSKRELLVLHLLLSLDFGTESFFAQLVPSPEMIDIMIYEDFLLNQPKKNKR